MNLSVFQTESEALAGEIIAQRRDFHRHPELGFQEHRTAGIVVDALDRLGLKIRTGVAKTGVIALLNGVRPGPTILLRFDMDALPIQEETGAPYASEFDGVMHACGHDGHTAIGMAVAKLLHGHRQELPGKVKFVFQPAEEGLNGAERMVEEGVLLDPTPDYTLAMHLWNGKPVGWIGITPGPALAGSERLEIDIAGRGGHGASPHQTVDPVLAAAQVICALQSVVSRNLDPGKPAVVSVTQIRAGDAFNVIPSRALLGGTIRTFGGEVRDLVLRRVEEIVCGIAEAMGCEAKVNIKRLTPPVINDQELAIRMQSLVKKVCPEAIVDAEEVSMGSEDMAFMMEDIPGCYILVGSNNPEKRLDAPHHNPRYDFDEVVLPKAAALMATATWMLLEGE